MSDAPVNTVADTANEWADFINTLVPPDEVIVEDASGKKHRLRANLPAAVETRIMRRIQEIRLPDMKSVGQGIANAVDVPEGEPRDVVGVLGGIADGMVKVLGDDEILSVVSECFKMAHPKACREAEEAVRADEYASEFLPEGPVEPHHLFSIADLVSGIVPFAMRAVSRIATTATSLLPQKTSNA